MTGRFFHRGYSSQSGDTTIFRNKEQLPGISLAIGDYEKKSIVVDSVQIELYNFKGHDFYSEVFPNISDTLAGFLQDVKSEYELRKGRKYPYQKFIMAETPISFAVRAKLEMEQRANTTGDGFPSGICHDSAQQ